MKVIISKIVSALYPGGGLLQDHFYKVKRRYDPYSEEEDTGEVKRNIIKFPGMGTNDRPANPGAGSNIDRDDNDPSATPISSGYNGEGSAQEQDAQSDGTGVAEPYDINGNELFRKLDVDRNWSRDYKDKTDKLLNQSVVTPSRRYDVDLLLKGKR